MNKPKLTEDQMAPLWYWINERHRIYLKRAGQGNPPPWTDDPILRQYRFCNVFREKDRVTLWLRINVRTPYADNPNLWFMYAIARQFNWPPTIQTLIEHELWPTVRWNGKAAGKLLDKLAKEGMQQYNGAYMTTGSGVPEGWSKARFMCEVLFEDLWQHRTEMAAVCRTSIREASQAFTKFNGYGKFLGYEVATDLRHCEGWLADAPDIYTWANAGPGAKRGLNRLFGRALKHPLPDAQSLAEMRYLLSVAPLYLEDHVLNRQERFEMRDIEHSLCETDKYLRAKTGEGRPKAIFRPNEQEYKF